MRILRVSLLGLALAVGLGTVANAATLTIGDARYMGFIDDGVPSGAADQVNYLNYLKSLAPGSNASSLGESFERSNNTLCYPTCPVVVVASVNDTTGANTGIPTGYTYLYAKYDGPNWGVEVWYIAGLTGTIDIPATAGGYGLSHYTLYNVTTQPCTGDLCDPPVVTPEPGTMLMLGTGLALLAARLRRRKA